MLTPDLIRQGMAARLWQQRDLASRSGVTQAAISRALSGKAGTKVNKKIFAAFKRHPPITKSDLNFVCLGVDDAENAAA